MPLLPSDVTIRGPIAANLAKLAEALAATNAFRDRVFLDHPATNEEIASRVHWPHVTEPEFWSLARPCAVLATGRLRYDQIAGGPTHVLKPSGIVELTLSDNDRHDGDLRAGQMDFDGWIGELIAELAAKSGEDDGISLTRIEQTGLSGVTDDADRPSAGTYWIAAFRLTWGWI